MRRALGAERIDLVGASYGTRVGLEYQRQFPGAVRRSVLDGVAPPDMALPASFSTDNQAAFDALLASAPPSRRARARIPICGTLSHAAAIAAERTRARRDPLSGRAEAFVFTREMLLGTVRSALYVPALGGGAAGCHRRRGAGDFTGLSA